MRALFLCRTALQARVCLEILRRQDIRDYDLLYLTQDDDATDHTYFDRLARTANASHYLFVPRRKPDLANHLTVLWRGRSLPLASAYTDIYVASLDNFLFRHVIKRYPAASLYGFDDGTGNISTNSIYHRPERFRKAIVYAAVLGLPGIESLKQRLKHHFSIYPGFDNIVPAGRTSFLVPFGSEGRAPEDGKLCFFIGQPFRDGLFTETDIQAMSAWLRTQHVDYYVMHPRESAPIIEGIPLLDKRGELAEDAIFSACGNKRPVIIAWFSTVLFNVSSERADKVYVSIDRLPAERGRRELVERTGATVVAL